MSVSYWESRIYSHATNLYMSDIAARNAFDSYVQGLIDGVEAHAIWDNGTQLCGAMRTPFKIVREDILCAAELVRKRVF